MFALCVEASHARGMGHLFRAVHLRSALQQAGERAVIFINDYLPAIHQLAGLGVDHRIVPLDAIENDWEGPLIQAFGVDVWVDDRLNTDLGHALRLRENNVRHATFDDRGAGAALADVHIAALAFDVAEPLGGRVVLRGADYLILNPEIAAVQRVRTQVGRLVVTLGGTDTYGVTVRVVEALRRTGRTASVIVGPGFAHHAELAAVAGADFAIKSNVPSLVRAMSRYDLAITGGGITPFEANAAGLPCVVIANEPFEVPVGRALERLGGSVFAGYHPEMSLAVLAEALPVEAMSRAGMAQIGLQGTNRVIQALRAT